MNLSLGNLLYIKFPLFLVSLICLAFASFLETAVTAIRLFKIKEIATTKKRYTLLLQELEKNPHRILVTILIASSFWNTATAALVTHVMKDVFAALNFSGRLGFTLGVGIATLAILIFGEIIPKSFAKTHGERIFQSTLWFTNIIYFILTPLVQSLTKLSSAITCRIGGKPEEEGAISEKEIQFLISYVYEKGLIEGEKSQMLQSIFSLNQKQVKEILVPAVDVVSISNDASLQDALDIFGHTSFSRLPVYESVRDNIVGMIYQKDVLMLLAKHETKSLRELMRPVLFIPESIRINQLLQEFKVKNIHMAIIVNEFGGFAGLVTLEDILEEIVGDINDENEFASKKIIPLERGGWLIEGNTPLTDVQKQLHLTFDSHDALTLAGFLTERLQHLPTKGERLLYKSYCFQVHSATQKRIQEIIAFEETQIPPQQEQQVEAT
ncbi:HlyC/CorC family transporter [Candidatus Babeliales bacterium]|nr:HlyC/CorC family transporter [Candidatus Babeliales bacterium]